MPHGDLSMAAPAAMSGSKWSEEMPSVMLFPANKPSSRADAVVLDKWVTGVLERYAEKVAHQSQEERADIAKLVDELVPVLSIGMDEVVRQVTHHCSERGVVLEKIWRTYVELFERSLGDTRARLKHHKERTAKLKMALDRADADLERVRQRQPEQIQRLSETLAGKFSQRQDELDEAVRQVRSENTLLRQHIREHKKNVESWFPLFDRYKDSGLREMLKTSPLSSSSTGPSDYPELRIAADYRRILAGMPEEERRRVGFFVSSLLGLRGVQTDNPHSIEGLVERKEHNAWKIELLTEKLKVLRSEQELASAKAGTG